MHDDILLIEEILQGSKAAMEVLVNKYYKMIFSYIYRTTGQYHMSYDLTQEVFLKMLKAMDKYDENAGCFKNWLFKIALNTTRDYFKSRSFKDYSGTVELDEEQGDEDSNVVELVTKMSESERIKNAVLRLDKDKRETIILRFYHDMKIKDIAKTTGNNESTIKSRLRLGIEMLKKILKEGEGQGEKGFRI